jgi:hypothetical protein
MSVLPPSLVPLATALAAFAPDLAPDLAALTRRLDLLVGRARLRPRAVGDDPDGYDGLARRGTYERLLLSEWALADAVPEEFDRRAATGEHAFLRLERKDLRGAPRVLALFCGGPSQLGGPRVVQVAALVTLWRRAASSGAELCWGALPCRLLSTRLDKASVQSLLAARAGVEPTPADVRSASDAAGPVDEVWVVGATTELARSLPASTLTLALEDVIEPEARAIRARLSRGGSTLGEATLELPAPLVCRRILADPFTPPASAPAPRPVQPKRATGKPADEPPAGWLPLPRGGRAPWLVRFQPGTGQLLVGVNTPRFDRVLLAWGLHRGSLVSPKPKAHMLPSGELAAIGWHGQRPMHVHTGADGRVVAWPARPEPRRDERHAAAGHGTLVVVGANAAYTDGLRQLYVLGGGPRSLFVPTGLEALALFRTQHLLAAVIREPNGLSLGTCREGHGFVRAHRLPGERVVWGGLQGPDNDIRVLVTEGEAGIRAFQLDVGGPTDGVHLRERIVPSGGTASTGRLLACTLGAHLSLIRWDADSARLTHSGTGVELRPARAPIDLTVSPCGRVAAWRTAEDTVEAWSLVTGAPLLLRHSA